MAQQTKEDESRHIRQKIVQQNFDHLSILHRDTLETFMVKADHPALTIFIFQFGIVITCVYLLANFELPVYLLTPLLLFFGFMMFSLYAPFHETTHGTAFKTKRLNQSVAWLTGLIYGYSPGMHQGFHFAHHRYTNQAGDPEKGFSLPPMPARTFFQIVVAGFVGMLVPAHSLALSFIPTSQWDKCEAAWTPKAKRKKLAWECRWVSLFWIGAFYLLSYHITLMFYILIGLFLGRFIHGCIAVVEHEGLASEGSMLCRTRSVVSNPVFRWFWWNMNYHAEHHAWPAIPFHQLPKLQLIASEYDAITEKSYTGYFAKVTRGAFLRP